MLAIKLPNGEFLELGKSTVRFQLKSPVFQGKNEQGSRNYTFKIPFAENTLKLSAFCNWGSRVAYEKIDVELYLMPYFWTFAKLAITDHTDTDISIQLLVDRSFFSDFGNKQLTAFDYNDPYKLRWFNTQLANTWYFFDDAGVTGTCDITFTFYTTDNTASGNEIVKVFTYNPATETIAELITRICNYFNEYIYEYRYYFEPITPVANDFVIYNLTNGTNSAFYFTITKSSADFTVTQVIVNNVNRLQAARVIHVESRAITQAQYRIFTVANPQLYTAENPSYFDYVNLQVVKITGNSTLAGQLFSDEQPFCPMPNLKYLIDAIHREFDIQIVLDDFFVDAELRELYLINFNDIFNSNRRPPRSWQYNQAGVFMFNEIVPDVKVKDLVNGLKSMFGVVFDYNSRTRKVRIVKLKTILASKDHLDITDKVAKAFSRSIDIKNHGYNYSWQNDDVATERLPFIAPSQLVAPVDVKSSLPATPLLGFKYLFVKANNIYYKWNDSLSLWEEYAEGYYAYGEGEITDEQILNITPLFNADVPWEFSTLPAGLPYDVRWRLPFCKQGSNQYSTDSQEDQLRLVFYRGERTCQVKAISSSSWVTGYYDFASSHNYDYNQNRVGNYSLSLTHADGLHANFLKEWVAFLNNATFYKFKVDWDLIDIMNLDLIKKIKCNNQEFLIDNLEFDVSEGRIKNVIISCYLIKPVYE